LVEAMGAALEAVGASDKTVAENPSGTPEEWQIQVLRWAKENGSGEYRPDFRDDYELTYECNDYSGASGAGLGRAA
jgi:hypothetical protein